LLIGTFGGAVTGATTHALGATLYSLVRPGHSDYTLDSYCVFFVLHSGATMGAMVGFVVVPLSFLTQLRRVGFRRAALPTFFGTLLLGALGAALNPLLGVLTGVAGFFLAFLFLAQDPDAFAREGHEENAA
jgi:hypothetical protein